MLEGSVGIVWVRVNFRSVMHPCEVRSYYVYTHRPKKLDAFLRALLK